MEYKKCVACGKVLPKTEEFFYLAFYKTKGKAYFQSRCRTCQAQYRKEYHDAHREFDNEQSRTRARKYYYDHREKISKRDKEYRRQNADRYRELNRMRQQVRRARKKQLEASLSSAEWEEALNEFDGVCAYCGTPGQMTQEHVVPLSKGGTFSKDNIIPACAACNRSKRASPFDEWYINQPFYNPQRREHIKTYIERRRTE